MHDLDNNLDDLLRKAAENYPVQSPDDWQKVAFLLSESEQSAVNKNSFNHTIKRIGLPVLLVFIFLGTRIDVLNDSSNNLHTIKSFNTKSEQISITQSIKNRVSQSINKIIGDNKFINEISPVPLLKKQHIQPLVNTSKISDAKKIKSISPGQLQVASQFRNSQINRSSPQKIVKERLEQQQNLLLPDILLNKNLDVGVLNSDAITSQIQSSLSPDSSLKETVHSDFKKVKPIIRSDPNNNNGDSVKQSLKSLSAVTMKQKRMYIGFQFGSSYNQIKNQGFQKNGYDIGFVVGYLINRNLSIKTGLIFDRKYYSSDGKYFNMTKASSTMPNGMQLISIKGSCNILEIPLNAKYNFSKNNRQTFFASLGVSSYLLTKESNQYLATINGNQQNIRGLYKNNNSYLPGVVNVGFGYEKMIGKSLQIRFEPYVQIPIKGFGIGSLPIMTSGIHIGIQSLF